MSELVDEGDDTYRVRRRRRSTIVIVVVLLALGGAFYYASSYWRASEPRPGPCTSESVAAPLRAADVSVNVYNATDRKGLAAAIAKGLDTRGFQVKSIANDPLNRAVKGVAEIRFGPAGQESANLLSKHVPKAALVKDKRQGDTIDLVAGQAWKALGAVPPPQTPTNTLPPCPTVTVTGA